MAEEVEILKGLLEAAQDLYELDPDILRRAIETGMGYSWTIYRAVSDTP